MREAEPDADRARRRQANRRGHRAEWIAALLLMLRGYRILARHFVVHGGEIDIVAIRGRVVAFVEVKARPGLEQALLAVTPTKQRRIERAAAVWLTRNGWARAYVLRGDAVLAAPMRWPRHVVDAFALSIG